VKGSAVLRAMRFWGAGVQGRAVQCRAGVQGKAAQCRAGVQSPLGPECLPGGAAILRADWSRSCGGEAHCGVAWLPAGDVRDGGGSGALWNSHGVGFGDSPVTHPLTPWLELGTWRGTAGRLPHPLTLQLRWLVRPPWDLPFSLLFLLSWPCTWLLHTRFPSHRLMLVADEPFEAFPDFHERHQPEAQTPQLTVVMNVLPVRFPPSFWTSLHVLNPSPALSLQC